ncbi:MAG TPA: glycosyltransferase family 39 protein [Acidimicrobiia bacterium]
MTASTEVFARTDPPAPTRAHALSWLVIAAVVLVIGAGIVLRFLTTVDLWLDEALSVNIARLPLSDLRGALKHDGAPPLYYVLLHFWIDVFGTGDVAVRALSGVLSVATLPLAYLAGKRIGGRSVAWWSVLILAVSPYAVRYATETRMYALVMFLVLWGYLALRRALDAPTLPRLAVVALVTALLVYSLYWSFYVVAVVGAGLLVAWRRGSPPTRHAAPRIVVAMVVGGLTLLPWLPTLVFQFEHTGTPWGDAVTPWFAFARALIGFVGGEERSEDFLLIAPLLVLPLLALFGVALDRNRIELDLRTRPEVRLEAAGAFAILVLGLTVSWLGGTAFDPRYAAVMFPLLVLVTAYGLTTFADPRVRTGILVVVLGLGLVSSARNISEDRTQAAQPAEVIRAEARRNDLVVYCPDQVGPDVSRLLEGLPLRQKTFPSGARPERVNWVDYEDRLAAADAVAFAKRMLREAGESTIWYVGSGGYRNVVGKCETIGATLDDARTPEVRVLPDDEIFELMGLTAYRAP